MRTRIGALALVLGAAVAWTSPAAAQDAEQNKALYTVVVNQVFNHGDLALADDLIAKDVTHNGSPFGRASFKTMVKEMRREVAQRALCGHRSRGRWRPCGGTAHPGRRPGGDRRAADPGWAGHRALEHGGRAVAPGAVRSQRDQPARAAAPN